MASSTNILVLFDNNGQEYASRIHAGARRVSQSSGFQVNAENLFLSRRTVAEVLEEGSFAGIVLTPPLSDDRQVLSLIEARGLPYVRIAPLLDPDRGSTVIMDEYDAARAITAHLLDKGHRRIGIIRGPRIHLVSMRRFNGYANAIGGKGLRIDPTLVVEGDFSRRSGRDEAPKLFAAKPTAIFASNDEMAVGVIDAARAANIAVPGDISVVGFDDNAIAKSVTPRLTSVRQPLEEMGETASRLVVDRIRNPGRAHEQVQVPYQVVERESVREIEVQPA